MLITIYDRRCALLARWSIDRVSWAVVRLVSCRGGLKRLCKQLRNRKGKHREGRRDLGHAALHERENAMNRFISAAMLGIAALAVASTGNGQLTSRASDIAKLRESIRTVPGQQVDLTKRPPTIAVPSIDKATVPDAARPGSSPTPDKAADARITPDVATSVVSRVRAGEALVVRLPAGEEKKARELLAPQVSAIQESVPKSATQPASQVKLFASTLRTLSSSGNELLLKPVAYAQGPLRFDNTVRRFIGRVAVGLLQLDEQPGANTLSTPITFEIVGDVRAQPATVDLNGSSPPFAHFEVAADDPREPVVVNVFFSHLPGDPVALQLGVDRPRLELAVAPAALQGWGLETAIVSVTASDGALSEGREVTLTPTGGTLEKTIVTLGPKGSAITEWRSASTGDYTITTAGAPFQESKATATFERPWRFGIAALIGGLVGSILRHAFTRAPSRRLASAIVIGVLSGLIVLGLFVLGVNVTGFNLPTRGGEVLVFVVSAIGALLGAKVLMPKVGGNES